MMIPPLQIAHRELEDRNALPQPRRRVSLNDIPKHKLATHRLLVNERRLGMKRLYQSATFAGISPNFGCNKALPPMSYLFCPLQMARSMVRTGLPQIPPWDVVCYRHANRKIRKNHPHPMKYSPPYQDQNRSFLFGHLP